MCILLHFNFETIWAQLFQGREKKKHNQRTSKRQGEAEFSWFYQLLLKQACGNYTHFKPLASSLGLCFPPTDRAGTSELKPPCRLQHQVCQIVNHTTNQQQQCPSPPCPFLLCTLDALLVAPTQTRDSPLSTHFPGIYRVFTGYQAQPGALLPG